jgi:hypothetical protein
VKRATRACVKRAAGSRQRVKQRQGVQNFTPWQRAARVKQAGRPAGDQVHKVHEVQAVAGCEHRLLVRASRELQLSAVGLLMRQ